jgi:hypothetical protein
MKDFRILVGFEVWNAWSYMHVFLFHAVLYWLWTALQGSAVLNGLDNACVYVYVELGR